MCDTFILLQENASLPTLSPCQEQAILDSSLTSLGQQMFQLLSATSLSFQVLSPLMTKENFKNHMQLRVPVSTYLPQIMHEKY